MWGFLFGLLLAAYVGVFTYETIEQNKYEAKRDDFVFRCEAKGGVALSGYRGTENWIGCYAGFEELENE